MRRKRGKLTPIERALRENEERRKRQEMERQVRNQQVVMTHTPPKQDTA